MPRSATLMSLVWLLMFVSVMPCSAEGNSGASQRLAALEERIRAASLEIAAMNRALAELKRELANDVERQTPIAKEAVAEAATTRATDFTEQVLGGKRAAIESSRALPVEPDVFLQTRFSTLPLSGATPERYPSNFRVSRLNTRWAGSLNERWGAGIEVQYRAAPDNVPEQLLNDAYLDFRVSNALRIRTGQFVKPFGFDVQQPDSERESPERAMFAGYVFPGERDRGLMLSGDLSAMCGGCNGLAYAAAVVNGNRFFNDSNRQVNYLFRLRKVLPRFAFGGSAQLGTQITPPGVAQTNKENAFGVDAQGTLGRLGLRGEFVHANRPSTYLAPTPVFAPAFVEGVRVRSVGASITALWSLGATTQIYARFDRLAGDTETLCPTVKDGSCKINAVNGGLLKRVASYGVIGIDVQWKDRLSFNNDPVNTKLQISSSLVF